MKYSGKKRVHLIFWTHILIHLSAPQTHFPKKSTNYCLSNTFDKTYILVDKLQCSYSLFSWTQATEKSQSHKISSRFSRFLSMTWKRETSSYSWAVSQLFTTRLKLPEGFTTSRCWPGFLGVAVQRHLGTQGWEIWGEKMPLNIKRLCSPANCHATMLH